MQRTHPYLNLYARVEERERDGPERRHVRRLCGGARPVDGALVEARWRAGLEAPETEAGALERAREVHRRRVPDSPRRTPREPDEDRPAQERPRREHYALGAQCPPVGYMIISTVYIYIYI